MIRFIGAVAVLALVGFGGWIAGSLYPAPWIGQVREAAQESVAAVSAIIIERVEEIDHADAPETLANAAPAAPASAAFEPTLAACPGMTVSNAPALDAERKVIGYQPLATINGVALAVNPTVGACLSSGFGARGGRTHRGVDYHSATGGPIRAAAAGTIIELKYRDDFGNMLLIDHGAGVYTRYAHLSTFQRGLAVGSRVEAGQQIGLMGNTASFAIPIHLHYEVLTGDYSNPRASFGLEARNPLVIAPPAP